MFLSDFRSLAAPFRVPQAESLEWLAEAQSRAAGEQTSTLNKKRLARFGCDAGQIARRGTYLRDFTHRNWDRMEIFGTNAGLAARQAFFQREVNRVVPDLYPEGDPGFSNFIHVTCTGYVAPSAAQRIASARGWGDRVEHFNAYHMGCYAAMPALRMARGRDGAEILHTELCTVHLDPRRTEPEQIVIQSLFADGIIRYRANTRAPSHGRSFEVEAVRERIADKTGESMTWALGEGGFAMTLARDVPQVIRANVAGVIQDWREPNTVYAIHPGGPRVIDAVKEALGLSEEQVHTSREILRAHGNMSSATLPHVWERMLTEIPAGTNVISVAFGPGLTIAAAKMRAT